MKRKDKLRLWFGNKLIGLDPGKETLLVSEVNGGQHSPHLIELGEIKAVSLLKGYGSIKAGELSKRVIGQFLQFIRLKFEYRTQRSPTVVSLFEDKEEERKDLHRIDLSSRNLHDILSKIVERG